MHPSPARVASGARTELNASFYEQRVKRPLDVVLVLLQLPLALPLVVVLALAIRVRLGPGVFYTQQRVGRHGRPFRIVKFRTMHHDRRSRHRTVHNDRRNSHKAGHDPRHTSLGRVFRRLSLDELPQLWNVLKGDMSLVGPRPELVTVARERDLIDHVRHRVRPGMTGPYQVSELRFNGDLRDGLDLDTEYVQHITLRGDLRYLLGTFTVLWPTNGNGA